MSVKKIIHNDGSELEWYEYYCDECGRYYGNEEEAGKCRHNEAEPQLSDEMNEAIAIMLRKEREEEREECAKIADELAGINSLTSNAIRARQ